MPELRILHPDLTFNLYLNSYSYAYGKITQVTIAANSDLTGCFIKNIAHRIYTNHHKGNILINMTNSH